MRLLIDANLSPKVIAALGKAGLESVHVGDVGLLTAPDRDILDYAAANALVIVAADSDFDDHWCRADQDILNTRSPPSTANEVYANDSPPRPRD